ncbi:plasmid mobilization protein [Paraburkholderia fungorum]|uniref:plasmid mobilization protein n=1 Tax=Paraburkholderia fungorum TaxID=134537 RepID=UPI0038BC9F69
MSSSETRQKTKLIAVRVTPEEKAVIQSKADAFGISIGELCRSMIFRSKPPKAILDQKAIGELAKTRADLGRIGGLLKGWLAGSFEESAGTPLKSDVPTVRKLLESIEKEQARIAAQLDAIFGGADDK